VKDPRVVTARDLMATRLVTLAPETDVLRAMRTLLDEGISGAPVVDEHGNLVGMLTQRDCLDVGLVGVYHREPAGRVREYMKFPVETLPATATLAEILEAFRGSRYRRFPVVEANRLIGQISRRDTLPALLALW
jgi:CBS domain-containing protein